MSATELPSHDVVLRSAALFVEVHAPSAQVETTFSTVSHELAVLTAVFTLGTVGEL